MQQLNNQISWAHPLPKTCYRYLYQHLSYLLDEKEVNVYVQAFVFVTVGDIESFFFGDVQWNGSMTECWVFDFSEAEFPDGLPQSKGLLDVAQNLNQNIIINDNFTKSSFWYVALGRVTATIGQFGWKVWHFKFDNWQFSESLFQEMRKEK